MLESADLEIGDGAGGRNRTDTLSPEQDFESSASTSSATPAYRRREFPRINTYFFMKMLV